MEWIGTRITSFEWWFDQAAGPLAITLILLLTHKWWKVTRPKIQKIAEDQFRRYRARREKARRQGEINIADLAKSEYRRQKWRLEMASM